MTMEIGTQESLNQESIYTKASIKLPNSDKVVAVNPERLSNILIERLFEPKYNVFGCQAIGYIKETNQSVIIRPYQVKLILESLLYSKSELDNMVEISSLFNNDELKGMFPDINNESQKIIISFSNGTISSISTENIDTKFKLVYIIKEIIYTLNGDESDLRSKVTLQQIMLALGAGVGGPAPKNMSKSGIVY